VLVEPQATIPRRLDELHRTECVSIPVADFLRSPALSDLSLTWPLGAIFGLGARMMAGSRFAERRRFYRKSPERGADAVDFTVASTVKGTAQIAAMKSSNDDTRSRIIASMLSRRACMDYRFLRPFGLPSRLAELTASVAARPFSRPGPD
jgi:hypothetical protein